MTELWFVALVATGPLPIVAALMRRDRIVRSADPGLQDLFAAMLWLTIQAAVALALGATRLTAGTVLGSEAALLVVGLVLLRLEPADDGSRSMTPARWRRWVSPLALGAIVVGTSLVFAALANPTTDYDTIAYHMPIIGRWMQEGRFVSLTAEFSDVSAYPFSWEAIDTLFVIVSRHDIAILVPNLVAWAAFGLAIRFLAIESGCSSRVAGPVAIMALAAPSVVVHVSTAHVDMPLAAIVLASGCFVVFTVRTGSWLGAVLAVTSLGLAVGTKASAFGYATVVLVVWAILRRTYRARPAVGRIDRRCMAAACVVGGWLGAFWYIRNESILGTLPGIRDLWLSTVAAMFRVSHGEDWRVFMAAGLWAFGLPGAVFSLLTLLGLSWPSRPGAQPPARILRWLLVLAGIAAALYAVTPFSGDNGTHGFQLTPWMGQALRFGFSAFGVVAVLAAVAIERTFGRTADASLTVLAFVTLALAMPDELSLSPDLPLMICAVVVAGSVAIVDRYQHPARYLFPAMAYILIIPTVAALFHQAGGSRPLNRVRSYGATAACFDSAVAPGRTVGYLLSHRGRMFYGDRFDRRVVYVGETTATRSEWIQRLRDRRIEFVAVGPLADSWKARQEVDWLTHDDAFAVVCGRLDAPEPTLFRLAPDR